MDVAALTRTVSWSLSDRLACAAGAAVDAAILALMKGPWAHPTTADVERLAAEVRASHELYRSLGWIEQPTAFHREPPAVPEIRLSPGGRWPMPHEWLSFPSGYAVHEDDPGGKRWTSYADNGTAHAWMCERDEEAPWLVCLHGMGMGRPFMDAHGFAAERLQRTLGVNLLFPVQPLHGLRRSAGIGPGGFLSFELLDTLHGFAQAVSDARRLVRWLRARGAKRVGAYGISLGAYTAALLATVEPLDFVLTGIPLCDVPELYVGHCPTSMRAHAEATGLVGPEMRELFTLVSPLAGPPLVPHEHRYLFAATGDRIVPPVHARRLWEHWERPTIRWYSGGHVSFFWTPAVQAFVERSLRKSGFAAA